MILKSFLINNLHTQWKTHVYFLLNWCQRKTVQDLSHIFRGYTKNRGFLKMILHTHPLIIMFVVEILNQLIIAGYMNWIFLTPPKLPYFFPWLCALLTDTSRVQLDGLTSTAAWIQPGWGFVSQADHRLCSVQTVAIYIYKYTHTLLHCWIYPVITMKLYFHGLPSGVSNMASWEIPKVIRSAFEFEDILYYPCKSTINVHTYRPVSIVFWEKLFVAFVAIFGSQKVELSWLNRPQCGAWKGFFHGAPPILPLIFVSWNPSKCTWFAQSMCNLSKRNGHTMSYPQYQGAYIVIICYYMFLSWWDDHTTCAMFLAWFDHVLNWSWSSLHGGWWALFRRVSGGRLGMSKFAIVMV